jgi:hypothetical protein
MNTVANAKHMNFDKRYLGGCNAFYFCEKTERGKRTSERPPKGLNNDELHVSYGRGVSPDIAKLGKKNSENPRKCHEQKAANDTSGNL